VDEMSEQEKRMRSVLYLVLSDLREQAAGRASRFTFDWKCSRLAG